MLRLLSVAFAVVAFGSVAAQAAGTVYRDPLGRFLVTVPEGWDSKETGDARIAFAMASPRLEETLGACGISWQEVSEFKGKTQAEVEAELDKTFTAAFWEAAFRAPEAKDPIVEGTGTAGHKGRKTHYAIASATLSRGGALVRIKLKQVVHAIPGSLQVVTCSSKADFYAVHETEFQGVFASYEPKAGELIVSAPPAGPAAVTLKAGPGGVASIAAAALSDGLKGTTELTARQK